ncbi:azurin [Thermomonas sp. HDW16]|uniref:azurin n=1 Tax=Thermomonas sp. HDW16 TaxID=2714945 RepID=UPI00140AD636|nr:azurin [Thermomonas sp. HDW16]QIL20751.1 azurin [Thermomonas sp. HDW16]
MQHRLIAIAVLLIASVLPLAGKAATCSVDLTGSDAMKYNMTNIDVSKSCKTFTINLKHIGKMARNVMGHNVVIAKTADMAGIDKDGMTAGLATDYIKAGDARAIAHSKVVGGGESTSIQVPVAKLVAAGAPLSFFCSFPGHSTLMKGTITLKP